MFLTTDEWINRVKTDMEELTPDWDRIVSQTAAPTSNSISAPNGPKPLPGNCLSRPNRYVAVSTSAAD